MTKLEAVQLLARLGVAPKFSLLGEGACQQRCCVSRRCSSSPDHPALSPLASAPARPPPPNPAFPTTSLPSSAILTCVPAVWERLEAENPDFFEAYYRQLEATVRPRALGRGRARPQPCLSPACP